jgi:hypothetical protein
MMRIGLLAALLLIWSSAVAQVTVDQMTCAEAQRYAHRHGRIYVKSPDGPLPVYPIISVRSPPSCLWPWVLWHHSYVSRDGVYCTVGYMCYEADDED